jgi:hypothetical protein
MSMAVDGSRMLSMLSMLSRLMVEGVVVQRGC